LHVLDLDLDFFLDRVPSRHPEGRRWDPVDGEAIFEPWDEESFRHFLEAVCGLSTERPTPGRVLRDHDEAFYCWRELIRRKVLSPPFLITHVDSHSDLGMGEGSYIYIMGDLLHRPVEERWIPDRMEVTPGSYLAYAAACRWPSRIEFVRHPRHHDDCPSHLFHDHDVSTALLELRCCDPVDMEQRSCGGDPALSPPVRLEPQIPVAFTECWDYQPSEPVDFVVLAQSPDYTPSASDALIAVFREYIVED
jgi:hypothetical protein